MISEKNYNDIYQKGYEDGYENGKNDNITKIEYAIKPSFTTRKLKELQQENKQIKDNWNKLKEFINLNYYDSYIYSSTIINKMQGLEKGDSNE